jgi:amino acid transporter
LNIIKKSAVYFARKKYCKTAIEDRADLSAIRKKPTPSMIIGLVMIAFSYVIGLPTVLALGVYAVSIGRPLWGVIGGIVIYAISTILFFIGIKMAGEKYFQVFCRWVVRVVLEKILGDDVRELSSAPSDKKM